MSIYLKEISQRIKGLREDENISVESLANEFNISTDEYKKYESGEIDIPIGFLYQFAHKFRIDLTALITGEEPKLHSYCVVRKDNAPIIERRKEYKYQDLSYNFINKKAETFLVTIEPKNTEEISCYSHAGQEFNYIMEGTLKIVLDGKEIILEKGDAIFFDSSLKHAMFAMNKSQVKFIAVVL